MSNSDDSTDYRAGKSGTSPEGHGGYQDPRYARPGGSDPRAADPRVSQGTQYPDHAPAPAAYPGAGASSNATHLDPVHGAPAHSGAYPATMAPATPVAPSAAPAPYGTPPVADYRPDTGAGYGTSADYPPVASSTAQHYASGQPEPAGYPEYSQPVSRPASTPDYPPATQHTTSPPAAGSLSEQHARTFGASAEPASTYGHSAETDYSGARGSHMPYTADQPAAATDYRYEGAAAPEPASALGGSLNRPDAGYGHPAKQDSYERDYESPFDTYASAPVGHNERADYQGPGQGDVYFDGANQSDAEFFDGEFGDEDYPEVPPSRRSRTLMVGGALFSALIVGGGLAYAYKNDVFGFMGSGKQAGDPPLIQADSKPAKIRPAVSGSKQAGNGGKLIYDRLEDPAAGTATAVANERIVARQESVLDTSSIAAQLNNDKAEDTASGSASMTPESMKKGSGDWQGQPRNQMAKLANKPMGSTGPRKVKTLVINPDGTVVKPTRSAKEIVSQPVPSTISTASINVLSGKPRAANVKLSSSVAREAVPPPAVSLPKPKPKLPEPRKTAALPAPVPVAVPTNATSAGSSQFAVQIAARRTQTDALATFANLQQKFPNLLRPYQPLIQKADLGSKGTWYRLRIGPMNDKPSASNLCSKLKSAGLKGCLVRPL